MGKGSAVPITGRGNHPCKERIPGMPMFRSMMGTLRAFPILQCRCYSTGVGDWKGHVL